MDDQAKVLRQLAWGQKRKSNYITVSSGKGGVGKTNFVINLAYLLASFRKKVLVFDADLGLANVDVLLNLNARKNIRDYLIDNVSISQIIINNTYGFDILPAASGFMDIASFNEQYYNKFIDIFVTIDEKYDYILFDTGAGISETVVRLAGIADYFIVITQAEPAAITDAYALMKVAKQEHGVGKAFLVLNRVMGKNHINVYENLNRVITKFLKIDLSYLGGVRDDKMVLKAVLRQTPVCKLFPKSHYYADLTNIANKLTGASGNSKKVIDFYNFFRRGKK